MELRPALFAWRHDLTALRYDFPLVLVEGGDGEDCVRSLTDIVDGVLRELAPEGADGESIRLPVLRIEKEIRSLAARGAKGSLAQLWNQAAGDLLSRADAATRNDLAETLDAARQALPVDGILIDCDAESPRRLVTHAWETMQAGKEKKFHKRLEALIHKLSEILQADFMKTSAAREPEVLRSSMGTTFEAAFDFDMMSSLLAHEKVNGRLSSARAQRIGDALSVLRSQKFFAGQRHREKEDGHDFLFDSCAAALDAFRRRLPEAVALVKAIAIADLEVENRYRDDVHDAYFASFDESMIASDDLALLPTYLIRLHHGRDEPADTALVLDAFASKLPVKILVESDEIPGASALDLSQPSRGASAPDIAGLALGIGDVYVLQAAGSSLYRLRDRILDGLDGDGPALISVFTGAAPGLSAIPPYLAAAAAEESRAFPTFTHDPSAGPDLASRFRVATNPQAHTDWPVHGFSWEDDEQQQITQDLAFTFVDFAACDRRWQQHLEAASPGEGSDGVMPAAEYLALDAGAAPKKVPYILMIDGADRLHRVMVDDRLIRAARRCAGRWRALQEMGGINNSYAHRLVEQEREAWESEREKERAEQPAAAAPEVAERPVEPAAAPEPAAVSTEAEPESASPDEAYIETPRCTTCNECTEINNRMFAYNEDMQAYIADIGAGTYRELVEAAESCQVAIIHPGKPQNQNEPGLDELIERAEPFI